MKRSIPFGKERDDFSLSINSIWWKGLFHLERRGRDVFDEKVFSLSIKSINSIWWKGLFDLERRGIFSLSINILMKGGGMEWLFAINKQYLMKRSIPFGKERDDFSLSINSIMKRSIPFGKERDDFSLSINSIWWKGLFHLERRGMTFRYQ